MRAPWGVNTDYRESPARRSGTNSPPSSSRITNGVRARLEALAGGDDAAVGAGQTPVLQVHPASRVSVA